MGSCVSLSRSPAPAPAYFGRVAKIVDTDGSLAKVEGPVTAREALALASGGRLSRRASPPWFLCSSDELGFDAPARALAADEPLQPGQLYFVLPASALRRPMSGQDMAALAVKAARALAVEAGLATPTRLRSSSRVAPLVEPSSKESYSSESAWKHDGYRGTHKTGYDGERTVGKAKKGGVRAPRRCRACVQRLSAIAEGSE